MPSETVADIGLKIKQYADAVLAMDVFDKKQAQEVIKIKTAQGLIEYHNSKKSPSLIELINDIVNAEKGNIKPGENFVVSVGGKAYEVHLGPTVDSTTELKILKEAVDNSSNATNNPLQFVDVNFPAVHIHQDTTKDALKFSVAIDGRTVFTEKSPRPRELQRGVIAAFGEKVLSGNPQQLAIMGTGTGKSWVIAGITHAVGTGIIVVPDDDLAKEMKKDAIAVLQGQDALEGVHTSKEFDTVEKFQAALLTSKQMILIADDPLFHEKAGLIKNTIVLMDESHQHTFKMEGMQTLKTLRDNNAMLALTGTPTSKLKGIFGKEMVDINVRSVMDRGGLRQNYRHTDKHVAPTLLSQKAVEGYFSRVEYLTRGPGVDSIDDIKRKIKAGVSEAAAIDSAIARNREVALTQKNFVFTGDNMLRKEVLQKYQQIADGTYPDIQKLERETQGIRREAEIEARAHIIKELHPEQETHAIRAQLQQSVPHARHHLNLKKEVEDSQRTQIALSVNEQALHLILPNVQLSELEKIQRTGGIEQFLRNPNNKPSSFNPALLEGIAPGLPPAQGAAYRALVAETAEQLLRDTSTSSLCKSEAIDLKALDAQYVASVSNATGAEESQARLDQLRTGLVMHLGSDAKYATGISISSVVGTQQLIAHKDDSLNNAVDTPQLHGRNIRATYRGAFNQQVVSKHVEEGAYVSLEDVYDEHSGDRMDSFFEREAASFKQKESFLSLKAKFVEIQGDKPQEDEQSTPGIGKV